MDQETRIEDMSPKDLDSALEGGTTQEEELDPDESASLETTDKTGAEEESQEDESDETSGQETISDEEGDQDDDAAGGDDDEEENQEDITHDPLKDTQRKVTQLGQENAKLRREKLELEKKLLESSQPKAPKEYDSEELEDLKLYKPDEYKRVMAELKQFEDEQREHQDRINANKEQLAAEFDVQVVQTTTDSIATVAAEVLGLENADALMGVAFDQLPQEVQDFYDSEEFQALITKAEANKTRYFEKDGSITADTVRDLWRIVTYDKRLQQAEIDGRRKSAQKIKEAARSGSKLGKIPNTKPTKARSKDIDELSDAEIHSMNKEQLKGYSSEL